MQGMLSETSVAAPGMKLRNEAADVHGYNHQLEWSEKPHGAAQGLGQANVTWPLTNPL